MTDRLLDSRVALITGAGSNVGRAVAELFAEHGARLALADLDTSRLGRLPKSSGGEEPLVIQADLTRTEDCQRTIRSAVERYGRIDVLCNTAGVDPPSATVLHTTSEADWDRIMAVNVRSVFQCCKLAIAAMLESGGGAIVNVASQGAIRALPGMAAYGVSKAAVLQMTRQIAVDYAEHRIRANCVCPSALEQPMLDRRSAASAEDLDRRSRRLGQSAPLGRLCTPADVARAMLFLASDASSFVTGVALPVDGGSTVALRP